MVCRCIFAPESKEKNNDRPTNKKQTFPVLGMSCAACAARVNKTLSRQEGVCSANVNLATAIATVEYDPSLCSPEMMKQAVQTQDSTC